MNRHVSLLLLLLLLPTVAAAQKYKAADGALHVALVINPYGGDRAGPETDTDAAAMAEGGLLDTLANRGVVVQRTSTVALTPEEEQQYGQWNRFGMANGHLADFAAENERAGHFNIGLYNNCSSASGMLGGLQHSGRPGRPLRVGMIWIDAHGDYNTPETTLSGMLGGMPVAVAAGHALTRMRRQSGLDPALPERYIVMACVRDTDPLEQDRIDRSLIEHLTVDDIRTLSENIHTQMERLSRLTDLIYIHVDLDVLYVSDDGHRVKKINLEDGRTLWISANVVPRVDDNLAVQLHGTSLIVTSTSSVSALDAVTGVTLWRGTTPPEPQLTHHVLTEFYMMTVHTLPLEHAGVVDPRAESVAYCYDTRNASGLIPPIGGVTPLGRLTDMRAVMACDNALLIQTGDTIRGWTHR